MVGAKFKALTPQEKSKYEEMAEKDKQRYTKAMGAYEKKQKGGNDSDGVNEAPSSDDDDDDDEDSD
jgi:hypothetical protein